MIVDGAKEMRLGEFARKCKEASLPLAEHGALFSMGTQKGAARKLTRSGALAGCVRGLCPPHTAHDIYRLDGRVPETVVSGETADISPFCEFGFWDWVKFRDQGVAFPGDASHFWQVLGSQH
eukprot:CCRYP_013347-RA/>CCRYP_013347-RA protein AED:0.44 eAED:0.44 QI:0/0/0/1/0/0/3/0/121